MELRKPKFVGKKTKWEKRRIARRFARTAKGKLPLAEPLTIASNQERQAALKKGKMVFYDGKKRIELPFVITSGLIKNRLGGVYKMPDGKIITMRITNRLIGLCELAKAGFELPIANTFFLRGSEKRLLFDGFDIGHMEIDNSLKGFGLALKAASKTEREVRARLEGRHTFGFHTGKFKKLYEKLGYNQTDELLWWTKKGKLQPKDNLQEFYRIEAIDPKTGKARIFTFPIKKTSSN